MKLQILKDNLSRALQTTSRFTNTRAQLPVLGNILLKAEKNSLTVSATNLETSISLTLGAKIEKEGEITTPSKIITDIVNNLHEEVVNIEVDKEQIFLSAKGFSSKILGMNARDFPELPKVKTKDSVEINLALFQKALSQTTYAVSTDETRPVLTGALFIFEKGGLTLVATDGFRLSKKVIPLIKSNLKTKIILPRNILMELAKVGGDGVLTLYFDKINSQILFSIDKTTLSSRIIEGDFPDYEKILPTKLEYNILSDKEELLRAIKLASVFARDSANIVKFTLKKDKLTISSESPTSGEESGEVDVKNDSDEKETFEVLFNYKFLEDFINSVPGEEIRTAFNENTTPGVFQDTEDKSYTHIIMPVKIQG
ncbi:DNA polymerase III subunit beta [Patescibacteria group bacterium]|nr:DNA polymerase III subunit beta [Patescibacteria group bacterium]